MRGRRALAFVAAALALACGPGAHAQDFGPGGFGQEPVFPYGWRDDDEWFRREPPLSPPQGLNGVIRPPREGEAAAPRRLERIRDVFAAMRACWRPPSSRGGPSGQQLTLRMSFKRSGEVFGQPRITYYRPGGDEEARERFRASIRAALERCTPLPVSDALGSAVAGRPFTFRFVDDRSL